MAEVILTLTEANFVEAAKWLACEIAAIKAVAQVESKGSGFQADGKLKILFERHHFSRLTGRRYDASHPEISNRKPGGYTKNEWARYEKAFVLAPDAATESTSWGMFQTMGFNYRPCGFTSAIEMRKAYELGAGEQLKGFVNFILASPALTKALRAKDWPTFARLYNGPGYAKNQYDVKMAKAYKEFLNG